MSTSVYRAPISFLTLTLATLIRWTNLFPSMVLTFVLAMALPGIVKAQDFSDWLSGKVHPLEMKLKEFNADWKRLTVHGPAGVNGNISVNVSGNSSSATSQNNLTGTVGGSLAYVTKGQMVNVGGRSYL